MKKSKERAIRFEVNTNIQDALKTLREFAATHGITVEPLSFQDCFGQVCVELPDAGYLFSAYAGIVKGMQYPIHGKNTCGMIQVIMNELENTYDICEVILVAIGSTSVFNNVSMRYSLAMRNKLEQCFRSFYICNKSMELY